MRINIILTIPHLVVGLSVLMTLSTTPLRGEPLPPSKPLYRSPVLWATGLTLASLFADKSIHGEFTTSDNNIINKVLGNGRYGRPGTIVEMMGEPTLLLPLSGVFYGAGAWLDDERARRVGKAGAVAILATGGVTLAVKVAVGRNRPYNGNDSDSYRPFHNTKTSGTSFPSGHASVSFAFASVVADEYDDWRVDGLSYGAATAVSISRIYQDRHWLSDIVGGAAIGIGIGKWARRREATRGENTAVLTDGRKVYFAWKF